MSVRATTTHIDKYGVTHRVDLIRTGYAGAPTELRGSDGFLRFAHENLSEADVFGTPIQRGRLDFGVWIESTGQKAVIDELFLSQEGQFLVQWYINNVLFWTGTVALDLSNFDEGAFPYRAQITAKDLTYLEGLAFPTYADPTPANSFATRRTLISLIAECLPYGLNIVTATSWVESNIDTAQDFLRQVYLDASVLQGLTRFEALNRILSDNGCFLKQADGVWLIEQLSAHTAPGSVKRWTYNASGVYQSEATVDPRTTANTDFKIVTGSLSSVAPAYKSVEVRYDANVGKAIEIPSEVDPRITAQTFSQQYISTYNPLASTPQAIETIRLIATGVIKLFNASANAAAKAFVDIAIRIQAGDQFVFSNYTTGGKFGWTNFQSSVITRAYFDGYDQATKIATYKAQVNIETDPIPAPITTNNYGRLSVTFLSSSPALQYEGVKFELVQGEFANIFRIEQTGQYSTAYSKIVNMGDGPRAYALTALRWQTGALSLDKVTKQWQRRGSTAWRTHSVNLAKEIMDFQRSYARTLQVVARGSYTPSKTLVYDLTNWYYIGGGFDGYTGDWTMTFVRNSFVPDVDALTTAGILTPTQVGVGIVAAIANTATNTTEAIGQFLLRLALPASGTISQIVVSDIDAFVRVKAGQVLRLVHPVTLQSDEVTVRADRNNGAFIDVDSVTLTADYPIGSYVFVSAQSVQAGILVGENAVRIFAEGQALGRLTADVNGMVTSLPVNLYTRVLRGMEMRVVNSRTGEVYAVTVNQNQSGPGEVTLDIEEQLVYARAGDVLAGDNSFQQSQITVTQGLIVLKVNSNGKLSQIKLGADDLGSEILIEADQITVAGQTTFLSALANEGIATTALTGQIPIVIRSATAPTVRPDTNILIAGDTWYKTDEGNLPYIYDGTTPYNVSGWIRGYTQIDGGNITTGTVDTNRLNVSGIITAGSIATVSGVNVTIRSTTAPTVRPDSSAIQAGDIWIKTDSGNLPYVYDGTTPFNVTGWVLAYTQINGGNIITNSLNADRIVAGSINATQIASATITGDKLVAGTITATQIASATITGDKLVAGTVTADKINVSNLNAVSTTTGALTVDGPITVGTGGSIKSNVYTAGSAGWQVNTDGSAEFNNVTVRGSLSTSNITGNLLLQSGGAITGGANADRYNLDANGLKFGVAGTFEGSISARELVFDSNPSSDPAIPRVTIKGEDISAIYGDMRFRWLATSLSAATLQLLDGADPRITLNNNGSATFKGALSITSTTTSTSKDTGSIVTEGGVGIEENLYVGGNRINFANLPTSDTGLAVGDLWRDSNTVKVKT